MEHISNLKADLKLDGKWVDSTVDTKPTAR